MELREGNRDGYAGKPHIQQQQLPDEQLRGFKQNALTCIKNPPFVELTCRHS